MKYKDKSMSIRNAYHDIRHHPMYWEGAVENSNGIVKVYMHGWPSETNPHGPLGGEYTRCRMVFYGVVYIREFDCIMSRRALIHAAHKFARDVAAGRVK